MKKSKIVVIITMVMIAMLFMINPIAKATIDPSDFDPNRNPITVDDTKPITDIARPIIDKIAVIGIVVAVIGIMIIGIKYMIGSVEQKAEYKKTMIPYIVGIFMIVGITQILNIVYDIVNTSTAGI